MNLGCRLYCDEVHEQGIYPRTMNRFEGNDLPVCAKKTQRITGVSELHSPTDLFLSFKITTQYQHVPRDGPGQDIGPLNRLRVLQDVSVMSYELYIICIMYY